MAGKNVKRLKILTADLAAYWLLNAVFGFLLTSTFGDYTAVNWLRFCVDVTEISAISFAVWLVLNAVRLRFIRPPTPLRECDICSNFEPGAIDRPGFCDKYPYECAPELSKSKWLKSKFKWGK